jgi:hypothetical protein
VSTLADAIAQIENTNPAYNNPGALEVGDVGNGTFGQNLTIFSSPEEGQTALNAQLTSIANGNSAYYSPSDTLATFANTWSNGDPNYAANLSQITGYPLTTPISQIAADGNLTSGNTYAMPGLDNPNTDSIVQKAQNYFGLTGFPKWIVGNEENIIFIVVGILLIAAGLFAFKQTQTIIQGATKVASKGAELVAA